MRNSSASLALTANEIYEIDKLNEKTLYDFICDMSSDKRELVLHLYSKNKSLKVFKYVIEENENANKMLIEKLEKNGVTL